MKNLKLHLGIFSLMMCLSFNFNANAQLGKKLAQKLQVQPPGENEAIFKLYADKERTKEITVIEDGTMDLYFRAYLWKDKTKRGDSPYSPMESEWCFSFQEGEFPEGTPPHGFDYGGEKGEVEAKNMKEYVASNDYIDIDLDLRDKQFLDYFVRDAEGGKKYKFTVRLEGECKHMLAQSVFEIDLSGGKNKYEGLLLADNADVEMPENLFAHDANLNAKTKQLLQITYSDEEIVDVAFYSNWETASNHRSRYIQCAFSCRYEGKCYINYSRVWSDMSNSGAWMDPSTVNQRSMNQVDCSKLE